MHSTELHLEQNFYASVIIAFIVISEIRKQLVGMWQFYQTIPESMRSVPFWMGFLVNIIIALSLIPINIIIIATTDGELDIVLNALAVLFVLELDNNIVDLSDDDEKAIYLHYFTIKKIERFKKLYHSLRKK